MKWRMVAVMSGLLAGSCGFAQETAPGSAYENDFEHAEIGSAPETTDFLILSGKFAVKAAENNRHLELGGAPLDTYAVVFGPDFQPKTGTGQSVSARIYGTAKGRRYPAFGVGLCGAAGYRLQVTPSKRALELYEGDKVVVSQEHTWKPGTWTAFRLRMTREGTRWVVQGRVWLSSEEEPLDWSVSYPLEEEPISGKASIWGIPYSGKPILFDDLIYRLSP